MANDVTLINGYVIETVDSGRGIQRQKITIGDMAGSTDDTIGPTTETAPITDTGKSALNGRLQRIAQNITTLINGILSVTITDGKDITFGRQQDTANSATDTTPVTGMSVLKQISKSVQATQSVAIDTSAVADGNSATILTPQYIAIVASSSGPTTIVTATAGKKVRVLAAKITANGAVNVKWQSHTAPTDLTGFSYYASAGDGEVLPFNPIGWFETHVGEALDINLSGAVAVGGHLTYIEV